LPLSLLQLLRPITTPIICCLDQTQPRLVKAFERLFKFRQSVDFCRQSQVGSILLQALPHCLQTFFSKTTAIIRQLHSLPRATRLAASQGGIGDRPQQLAVRRRAFPFLSSL